MDEHAEHAHAKGAMPAGHGRHTAAQAGQDKHGAHDHHAHMVADFRQRFWISLALTVPILALSSGLWEMLGLAAPVAFRGDAYVLFGFSSVVFFYGGWPFLKGFGEELRQRRPGMMTLIAVAISAAYFYSSAVTFGLAGMGFYWELATLIDIMLLGHWIEMKSVLGASGALEALVRLLPSEAHRVQPDGNTEDTPVGDVAPGDRILVKPGERVPTDGIIVSGQTSLDESMLTGESKPVEKGEGAEAIGGSVNGEGAITLEVKKTGGQTYLAQVMDMVRKAQESRSRTQDLANRAAVWLTAIALGGGFATLFVWLTLGRDFAFAMERAVTVMVIACPHALGLAVPLVVAVSTSMSASHGLLIRDRAAFERARNLGAVVFDKTGTLTEGRFGVSDIVPLGELDETACLRLASCAGEPVGASHRRRHRAHGQGTPAGLAASERFHQPHRPWRAGRGRRPGNQNGEPGLSAGTGDPGPAPQTGSARRRGQDHHLPAGGRQRRRRVRTRRRGAPGIESGHRAAQGHGHPVHDAHRRLASGGTNGFKATGSGRLLRRSAAGVKGGEDPRSEAPRPHRGDGR